jgi:hypothetical protein
MPEDTRMGRATSNARTCVIGALGAFDLPPPRALGPRESFFVAYDRLALLAGVSPAPGFVVAAVDPRARVIASLCLADRDALVLGRHTQCGIRLDADTVSLRHVVALVRFEEGRPLLRLWDLRTGVPFITEDQRPNGAVSADGPLYVSIGGYALWFVPTASAWSGGPEAAWRALPPRSFIDRREHDARPLADPPRIQPYAAMPANDANPRGLREPHTMVTSLLPPLLMGEGPEPEVGWGELRLVSSARRERRTVSAERLEQGLLIGRYERCGVMVSEDHRISRVHLLLVRIGGEVWAIDTASTNGVRRDQIRFSAGVLRDADQLALGADVELAWRRTPHPDA